MPLDYFKCYLSYEKQCDGLSDSEIGRLFRALMQFAGTGEVAELKGREAGAYRFIIANIREEKERHEKVSAIRSENGKKGGRPKSAEKHQKAKKANAFFAFDIENTQNEKPVPDTDKSAEKCRKANAFFAFETGKTEKEKQEEREQKEEKESNKEKEERKEREERKEKEYNNNNDNIACAREEGRARRGPSVSEVSAYCESRKNGIDAQYFVNYYAARGWMLSKNIPLIDWKSCVRVWEMCSQIRGDAESAETADGGSFNTDDFVMAALARSEKSQGGV